MPGDDRPPGTATDAFERALAARGTERYVLRLYVADSTPRALFAIKNVRRICEERLHDRVELEIVDIYENPDAMTEDVVLATPTLIRRLPTPLRTVIGDLSDERDAIVGLDLVPAA